MVLKKQIKHWLVVVMMGLAFAVIPAWSQTTPTPPNRMTYQGYLTDGAGNAIGSNGAQLVNVIFKIYAAATGGTPVWAEQQAVTVDNGNFSVQLGEGTAVSGITNATGGLSYAFTGAGVADRYVGLTLVGFGANSADVEITPRVRLVSAPYAHFSTAASGLVGPSDATTLSFPTNGVTIAGNLSAPSLSTPVMTVGNLVVTNSLSFAGLAGGFVSSTETSLRVIAGRHRWTNTTTFLTEPSPGYSVSRTGAGQYKITFDTAFNSVPNVVATPIYTDATLLGQNCDVVQSTDPTVSKKEVTIRFNGLTAPARAYLVWNGYGQATYQNISYGSGAGYSALLMIMNMPNYPMTAVDGDFCFLVMGN
jgi:hypothetical protein